MHRPPYLFLQAICGATAVVMTTWSVCAQDFSPFRSTAIADTQQKAAVEAYYQALLTYINKLAGAQAEGLIGAEFRKDFERDFATFKQRYFTPDTDFRCAPRNNNQICEVEGSLKTLAIQIDFARLMKATEQTLSNQLIFVLSAENTSSQSFTLMLDTIAGVFLRSGYQVLSGGATNAALEKKAVDFSLALYEATFSPITFDRAEQRGVGDLVVRFKLNDLRSGRQVASVPVTASASIAGISLDAVKAQITDRLVQTAAAEINKQVNSAVVTFQADREQREAAATRAVTNTQQYVVQVSGISQQDREQLAIVRETIKRQFPDSEVLVDPALSNNTKVTLTFTTKAKVDPDSLVDQFYSAFKSTKNFESIYKGSRLFLVNL